MGWRGVDIGINGDLNGEQGVVVLGVVLSVVEGAGMGGR